LKAGVIDFSAYANRQKTYSKTSEGVPQGGTISPFLANLALHGMENRIKQVALTLPGRKTENCKAISLIRFADDFVILHKDLAVIQRCQRIISEWLSELGLELKPSKIRISHTLNIYEDRVGFDFLGFAVLSQLRQPNQTNFGSQISTNLGRTISSTSAGTNA
jgi:RNA-directed DNA polymerase